MGRQPRRRLNSNIGLVPQRGGEQPGSLLTHPCHPCHPPPSVPRTTCCGASWLSRSGGPRCGSWRAWSRGAGAPGRGSASPPAAARCRRWTWCRWGWGGGGERGARVDAWVWDGAATGTSCARCNLPEQPRGQPTAVPPCRCLASCLPPHPPPCARQEYYQDCPYQHMVACALCSRTSGGEGRWALGAAGWAAGWALAGPLSCGCGSSILHPPAPPLPPCRPRSARRHPLLPGAVAHALRGAGGAAGAVSGPAAIALCGGVLPCCHEGRSALTAHFCTPPGRLLEVVRPLGLPHARLGAALGIASGFLGTDWQDPAEFKFWWVPRCAAPPAWRPPHLAASGTGASAAKCCWLRGP